MLLNIKMHYSLLLIFLFSTQLYCGEVVTTVTNYASTYGPEIIEKGASLMPIFSDLLSRHPSLDDSNTGRFPDAKDVKNAQEGQKMAHEYNVAVLKELGLDANVSLSEFSAAHQVDLSSQDNRASEAQVSIDRAAANAKSNDNQGLALTDGVTENVFNAVPDFCISTVSNTNASANSSEVHFSDYDKHALDNESSDVTSSEKSSEQLSAQFEQNSLNCAFHSEEKAKQQRTLDEISLSHHLKTIDNYKKIISFSNTYEVLRAQLLVCANRLQGGQFLQPGAKEKLQKLFFDKDGHVKLIKTPAHQEKVLNVIMPCVKAYFGKENYAEYLQFMRDNISVPGMRAWHEYEIGDHSPLDYLEYGATNIYNFATDNMLVDNFVEKPNVDYSSVMAHFSKITVFCQADKIVEARQYLEQVTTSNSIGRMSLTQEDKECLTILATKRIADFEESFKKAEIQNNLVPATENIASVALVKVQEKSAVREDAELTAHSSATEALATDLQSVSEVGVLHESDLQVPKEQNPIVTQELKGGGGNATPPDPEKEKSKNDAAIERQSGNKQQQLDKQKNDPQITIDERGGNANHIFRDRKGHLTDTPENRKKLIDLVSDPKNFEGTCQNGTRWFGKILSDGQQLWAAVRDNWIIKNAGINREPRVFNPETGFCRNIRT